MKIPIDKIRNLKTIECPSKHLGAKRVILTPRNLIYLENKWKIEYKCNCGKYFIDLKRGK